MLSEYARQHGNPVQVLRDLEMVANTDARRPVDDARQNVQDFSDLLCRRGVVGDTHHVLSPQR